MKSGNLGNLTLPALSKKIDLTELWANPSRSMRTNEFHWFLGDWLPHMLALNPRRLVAMAMANRMAPMAWALMMKKETCRDSYTTVA